MDGGVAGLPGQSALSLVGITTSPAHEHAQRFDCQLYNLLTRPTYSLFLVSIPISHSLFPFPFLIFHSHFPFPSCLTIIIIKGRLGADCEGESTRTQRCGNEPFPG